MISMKLFYMYIIFILYFLPTYSSQKHLLTKLGISSLSPGQVYFIAISYIFKYLVGSNIIVSIINLFITMKVLQFKSYLKIILLYMIIDLCNLLKYTYSTSFI